ncbi:hypothetical protein BaRGS_00039913, partial [Batillaria attramentaria]
MATYENSHDHTLTSFPGQSNDDSEKDENEKVDTDWTKERYQWTTKREYLLSAIGYSVGLGNIWRFPYLCQRNGGGAFLIPFVICLVLCGLPLFMLEAALGQFTGRSALHVWSVCPLMTGVGVSMVLITTIILWYYNAIMAWALYYLVNSFLSPLPWSRCDGWWNTANCTTFATESASELIVNASETTDLSGTKQVSASEEFWQNNVLQVSSGLDEPGHVVWYLAVGLGVTLLSCFLGLIKGIKSSGKTSGPS